jgi:DNA repair protein SbcC/Rad50
MRLKKVTIKNFRCFQHAEFDLDADIVAIYARNGVGKTSFFDAIEYALLGNINHLNSGEDSCVYLKNVYSSDDISIRIDFKDKASSWFQVDKVTTGLKVSGNGGWRTQKDFLYEVLVSPKYQTGKKENHLLAEILRSTLLLSQENIRLFVEGEPDLRARILTYLAGDGYAQKCLIRVGKVEKEILSREKEDQGKLDAQQLIAKDLEDKINYLEAKLNSFKSKIQNASPKTFADLLKSLKSSLVTQIINEPQAIEELESLVLLVKNACEERFVEISKKNQTLAEIEILAIQHASRADRLTQIQTDLKTQTVALNKHREDRLSADKAKAASVRLLNQTDDEKKSLIWKLEILQKIPSLRLEADRLKNQISQLSQVIDQRRVKQESFSVALKERQEELDSIKEESNNLQNAITRENKYLENLKGKNEIFPRYMEAKIGVNETQMRFQSLEQKRNNEMQALSLVSQNRDTLIGRISEIDSAIAAVGATQDESKTLIARLKEFAKEAACPLCGHEHASNTDLIIAIDNQLQSIPGSLQLLLRSSQELENEKTLLVSNETTLNLSIETLNKKLEELIILRDGQQKIISDFEADLESIHIESTQGALEEAILNSINLISDRQSHLQRKQERFESSKVVEKNIADQFTAIAEILPKEIDLLQKYEKEFNGKESEIQEFLSETRIAEDLIMDGVDRFKKELVLLEQKRVERAKQAEESEKRLLFIVDEIKRIERALSDSEEEQRRLVSFIQDFNLKCQKIGLKSTTAKAIDDARAEITAFQSSVNETLKTVEEYRWAKFSDLINEEYSSLKSRRAEAAIEIDRSITQKARLSEASVTVLGWKKVLDGFVNSSVERTIDLAPEN